MKTLLSIYCALLSVLAFAQHTNFNTQRNWTLNKKEVLLGAGVTQFMGDLGGTNKLGPDYHIPDLNFPSTGWKVTGGYRYRFHPFWATVSKIHLGQLEGNDALKIDTYQHSRNLHFRTFYVELSQRIDVILSTNEKFTSCRSLAKSAPLRYQFYAYTGLGLLAYNPQAKYDGDWIDLQPLRTEGQGLPGGPKSYSRVTASITGGLGIRWDVGHMWRIGTEVEYIGTFSDYLDDVGRAYYAKDQLAAEVGEMSAYLSDPSTQNTDWFSTGQARGNSNRFDGFFSFALILTRNVTYKDYGHYRKRHPDSDSEKL